MRSFIAINLPKETKEFLSRLQEKLKSAQADVKWVKPTNIHLTLKFLGEIDEELAGKIKDIIAEVCKGKKGSEIILSYLGAFPDINQPRVVWIGISQGEQKIENIASELDQKINQLGIPKEKRSFRSHITLGRVRSGYNRQNLSRRLQEVKDSNQQEINKFELNTVSLFKSTLTAKGPIYEEIYRANLIAT